MRWPLVRLGSVTSKIGSGATPRGGQSVYVSSGTALIRSQNVLDNSLQLDGVARITEEAARQLAGVTVLPGDVLINITGDSIARVARASTSVGSARVNQHVAIIRPSHELDGGFLQRVLVSPAMKDHLLALSQGGATRKALTKKQLQELLIPMPDLATQTAIADVLGALDDKIAANGRVIQVSEDLLRTRFLRECDRAQRILRVSDILEFNPPRPRPLDDEAIYVEMKDLGTHTSVITSWSRRAPLGGVRFQRGDTVMGRITPCLENGKVGYVDFLREGEIGIGSTEFIAMATRDGLPKPLSFLVAEHPGFRQEAVQLMVGTSGRQRVSARDLGEIELQLPDDGTLRELGRAAEAVFELLARLRNESRSLAATRDALLPELMSGRLTIRTLEDSAR